MKLLTWPQGAISSSQAVGRTLDLNGGDLELEVLVTDGVFDSDSPGGDTVQLRLRWKRARGSPTLVALQLEAHQIDAEGRYVDLCDPWPTQNGPMREW